MVKKTKKEHTDVAPVANCDQLTNAGLTTQQSIQNCILTIRGQQVMLDRDLAVLYGVETKRINEAVKRNIERFPGDFMFQLTQEETLRSQFATSSFALYSDTYDENGRSRSQIATLNTGSESDSYIKNESLRSQFATLKKGRGSNIKYAPYAFTESGITMLSCVLRSETAIRVNVAIMRAFTAMRQFLNANAQVFQRLETIEFNQLEMRQQLALSDKRHETNEQILSELLHRFDEGKAVPTQGIFYNGQIFDAYVFVNDLIRSAKVRIVLIDNYVDDTVLERLDKREAGVKATIYTRKISRQFQLDIAAHNSQQPPIEVLTTDKPHDRFLIIDNEMYLIGASIKDLGKKIFGFTKMEEPADELLKRLED